jgi:hypothetical protein
MTNKGTKMAKKLNCMEIGNEINTFIRVTVQCWNTHAYAAGALQSQLAYVLSTLPAHKQQETLQVLATLTSKYEQKVA